MFADQRCRACPGIDAQGALICRAWLTEYADRKSKHKRSDTVEDEWLRKPSAVPQGPGSKKKCYLAYLRAITMSRLIQRVYALPRLSEGLIS